VHIAFMCHALIKTQLFRRCGVHCQPTKCKNDTWLSWSQFDLMYTEPK